MTCSYLIDLGSNMRVHLSRMQRLYRNMLLLLLLLLLLQCPLSLRLHLLVKTGRRLYGCRRGRIDLHRRPALESRHCSAINHWQLRKLSLFQLGEHLILQDLHKR